MISSLPTSIKCSRKSDRSTSRLGSRRSGIHSSYEGLAEASAASRETISTQLHETDHHSSPGIVPIMRLKLAARATWKTCDRGQHLRASESAITADPSTAKQLSNDFSPCLHADRLSTTFGNINGQLTDGILAKCRAGEVASILASASGTVAQILNPRSRPITSWP